MKVRWEVEDGYVGKSRPHYVDVPDDELAELEGKEQDALIEEYVKQDFEQTVSYVWSRP